MRQAIRFTYSQFSQSALPILKLMDRVTSETPAALRNSDLFAQHKSIQLGSVVLISGYLESFLRAVCETYFAELARKGFGMSNLGDEYLSIHLREGAGHLADLVKREQRKKKPFSESSAFVRRLVAPILDNTKSPVWEAFARTQGNPSPEVVKAILKALGIKGGFDVIETALDGKYSSNTLATLLTNLNEIRNECAHTGTASSVPSPGAIKDLVQYTRHLTLGICRVVDNKISQITTP